MDEAGSSQNQNGQNRNALNKIEFFKHALNQEDKEEVLNVLNSLFLSTGNWVADFEQKFAAYLDIKYVVGVTSCTHALQLCLRYFNIGFGDEVITTPLSFVATANAIEYVGAKPIFVDVEASTGNIDASLIEAAITPRTKAIIPVHLYGQMCDMKAIRKIANAYNLKVIEDAAHCIEGSRSDIKVGQLGDATCFSFYATKNITSGDGGAIATSDEEMYRWLLQGRNHGLSSTAADRYTKRYQHYDMNFLGMKCNMTNIQAALLIHQLERIESLHAQREKLFCIYDNVLKNYSKPGIASGVKHAYHLYTLWSEQRDLLLSFLQENGVGTAVHYRPIHLMFYYHNKYGYQANNFPIAEKIGEETISLPLYPNLKEEEASIISEKVKEYHEYHSFI